MSQPNQNPATDSATEKQLGQLTPAAPGPQVRQAVAAAAQSGAAMTGSSAPQPMVNRGVVPPRSAVLPLRRVFSIAAMILCAAAVGLMAWYSQQPSRHTGGVDLQVARATDPTPGGETAGTVTPAKHVPTSIDILNTAPQLTAQIDPRYEVAKQPVFCRLALAKGLVTGHEAKASAGRWNVLEAEDVLKEGATVRVAGDGLSYAVLTLQDGSELLVGSGSEITLTSLRDIKLNGGRALVRVSPGKGDGFQLTTSANEKLTVAASKSATTLAAGSSIAAFQVTDRAFAMGNTDAYIPRWQRSAEAFQKGGSDGSDAFAAAKVSNLAVLSGAVALSAATGSAVAVSSGSRVDLSAGHWAVEHNLDKLSSDCLWLQACAVAADRGIGSLQITSGDAQALSPIEVGRVNIRVEVRDQIALTVIDEYFINKNDRQLEGKFFFPLPADASISGFAMWIDDRKVQGEIVERERAREIYEQILRENRDPGLLEWAGGNEFQARIFPIPPKGEKHIRISYTQVLPYRDGRVHYSYPLMSEMLRKNPLLKLEVAVNIHEDATATDLRSESHAAKATGEELTFAAQDYAPAQDFSASWIPNGQMPELKVMPHVRADEGGFYMAMVTPRTGADGRPITPVIEDSPEPRRWLFVVDASGSVTSENWALTRAALESMFATAGGEDTFNVVVYDLEPRLLFPDFVAANGVNFDNVSKQLSSVDPFGASNVEKAFGLAAGEAAKPGLPTTLVYLGDGVASAGEQRTAKLIDGIGAKFDAIPGLQGYAVAIGGSYESGFIDGVARRLHGLGLRLDGLNNIPGVVGQLTDSTGGELLTDLAVTVNGVKVAQQYPQVLPNLRLGDQLILTGRYTGSGPATVVVSGMLGGKKWSQEYRTEFPEGEVAGTNNFVPRLWAKRHITALLNQMDLEIGDAGTLKNEIIDASKKFTLITPFTSFLVLESEEDYRRFNVEHSFNMEDFEGKPGEVAGQAGEKADADMGVTDGLSMDSMEADLKDATVERAESAKPAAPAAAAPRPSEPMEQLAKAKSDMRDESKRERAASRDKEINQLERSLQAGDDNFANDIPARKSLESNKKQAELESLDEAETRQLQKGGEGKLRAQDGRFNKEAEGFDAVEVLGVGGGGGGGSYGHRSAGGRRRAVMRGGGSRATESIFPDGVYSGELGVNYTGIDGNNAEGLPWVTDPVAAPQSIGEYRLVATQLPVAIEAQALPTLKQIAGRLNYLACQLANVDLETKKVGQPTDRIQIRSDAVERTWLDGSGAKLTNDGSTTLLTCGEEAPLKRKAQAGDRFLVLNLGPAFLGYTLEEIAAAYDVTQVADKAGIVTLRLIERNAADTSLRVQVDTARQIVLRIERYQGDTLQSSVTFDGYREVATGVQAPTTATERDAAGKVVRTTQFLELQAKLK